VIRIVFWTNLNAQSVCTYQIWIFLILWCSTWLEESKDYKFVIFGHLVLKIWIKPANRRFDSNLKIVSNWSHKIWVIIVLLDSRYSQDSNGISFVIFGPMNQKIWILQDLMWASLKLWTWSIGCHSTRETKLRVKILQGHIFPDYSWPNSGPQATDRWDEGVQYIPWCWVRPALGKMTMASSGILDGRVSDIWDDGEVHDWVRKLTSVTPIWFGVDSCSRLRIGWRCWFPVILRRQVTGVPVIYRWRKIYEKMR
jgi:hypothetical protein